MPRITFAATLLFVSAMASSGIARADDKRACVEAYRRGQQLKAARQFTAARAALIQCGDRSCPTFMQSECAGWLAEVDNAQPSIVIEVRDAEGHEKSATALRVDGVAAPNANDGRAIALDPGTHDLEVELEGGAKLTQRVVVREGEKFRHVAFAVPGDKPAPVAAPAAATTSLAPEAPASSARTSSGIPPAAWVTGGVALVAVGSAAYFGISGVLMQSDRKSTCAPRCDQSVIDDLRTKYLIADVSMAVAVVAGAATVWLLLTRDSAHATTARAPLVLGTTF